MSEKRRAGFAKWDPPVLPLGEASDLVVRSIDRLLDEEEEMDQSPTPMEPKLISPTSDPSMAADKEQPRGVVSASCTPTGAAEARTLCSDLTNHHSVAEAKSDHICGHTSASTDVATDAGGV